MESKHTRLEPVFLMSVIQYIDSLTTLENFHQVSKNCDQAINRSKKNNGYQERTVEVMLSDTRYSNIVKEINIFEGLETLHVDLYTLEKLSINQLDKNLLFEIPYLPHKVNIDKFKNLQSVKDRIVSYGADLSQKEDLDFGQMYSLREVRLRVTKTINEEAVKKAISGLRKLEHLRKLIILCDSQYVKFFWDLVKDINYDRTNVIFKLNWFRDEDVPIINEVSNRATVGIFTNGLGKFHDVFLMKNVALLYYTDYYLQISHYMSTDVHFQHLINDYFPWKMEIQGNNLQAHVGERGILKMKGLTCLTELFVNEARYDEKIKIEFPKSLQYLNINNVNSFDKHGLIGLEETMVPKDIIGQYSSNI